MNEVIEWESDDQAMYVQIESSKEYLVLTKEAFESKSARTLDNYILTCKASTRSVANNNKKEGRNKELYGGQKRIALVKAIPTISMRIRSRIPFMTPWPLLPSWLNAGLTHILILIASPMR